MKAIKNDMPASVKSVIKEASPKMQERLFQLRDLVLEVASESEIGGVQETLKWNAPAYIAQSGKGTTIRLEHKDSEYFLRVHCQSRVVDRFRTAGSTGFEFDGTRGLQFKESEKLNGKEKKGIKDFIRLALTYHSWK